MEATAVLPVWGQCAAKSGKVGRVVSGTSNIVPGEKPMNRYRVVVKALGSYGVTTVEAPSFNAAIDTALRLWPIPVQFLRCAWRWEDQER